MEELDSSSLENDSINCNENAVSKISENNTDSENKFTKNLDLVSSETILSNINEECNKITENDKNGLKSDTDSEESENIINPFPESENIMNPFPESENIMNPFPESENIMNPFPESENIMNPFPESENIMNPFPESEIVMNSSPEPDEGLNDVNPLASPTNDDPTVDPKELSESTVETNDQDNKVEKEVELIEDKASEVFDSTKVQNLKDYNTNDTEKLDEVKEIDQSNENSENISEPKTPESQDSNTDGLEIDYSDQSRMEIDKTEENENSQEYKSSNHIHTEKLDEEKEIDQSSETISEPKTPESQDSNTDGLEIDCSGQNRMEIDKTEENENSQEYKSDSKVSEAVENSNNDEEKDSGKVKIKLRSFASLCEDDSPNPDSPDAVNSNDEMNMEVSGVAVGDIVQHSNFVESDECGVMHLKISNVVGGEDCITGLTVEENGDSQLQLQISSVASLVEPFTSDDMGNDKNNFAGINVPSVSDGDSGESNYVAEKKTQSTETDVDLPLGNKESSVADDETKNGTVVNIFKSSLIVSHSCTQCKKKYVCEFRMVLRNTSGNKVNFLCSVNCKNIWVHGLPENHSVQKPRLYFERFCGMCGKEISSSNKEPVLSWQTREFCNKLCLADHIGEVARTCFYCKSNVRVIYMVKYCVRFGSDVHQFCCNSCLETYKSNIKVCSFCQKNLTFVHKVLSPANKEYCSNKCLKRAQRRDIGQMNYKEQFGCTVCLKVMVNKYEFLHNGASVYLCSNPCMNVFKYVNKVKSVNCCLCSRLLNAEDTCKYFFLGKQLKVFCSESCFSVFVISARKIVTCHYCKVKKYNFDMIWSRSDSSEYFCCSYCCLNFVDGQCKFSVNFEDNDAPTPDLQDIPNNKPELNKVQPSNNTSDQPPVVQTSTPDSVPATVAPIVKKCNMCDKLESAQFHMVMSDSTLRSFCSYACATRYKCTFGFQVSGGQIDIMGDAKKDNATVESASNETQTSSVASGTPIPAKFNLKDAKKLFGQLCPQISNKSTMCRPISQTKGIQCRPHQWQKSTQTDEEQKVIIPVPIPIYVPTPLMMYSAPTPVPMVIPVPVPIPVFIPTNEKCTADIERKIKTILEDFSFREKEKSKKRKLSDDEEEEESSDGAETEIETLTKVQQSLRKFYLSSAGVDENHKGESDSDDVIARSAKRRKAETSDAETTLESTHGLSVWQSWVRRKNSEGDSNSVNFPDDLATLSSKKLNGLLISFLDDISKRSLKFDADAILYVLLGLQKHLFEKGSTHCIFLEVNFDLFTNCFDELVRRFFLLVTHPGTKRLNVTRVTEEMMWEARQLGAHTPHVLINTLFYFNTKIFKLKTAMDHFNLALNQVSKETRDSPTFTTFLHFTKDTASNAENNLRTYEMVENKENPLRCPVKLYEFYLLKCPEQLRQDQDSYYVYPERTCLPDSAVWYSSDSLDVRTIDKMLNRILLVKEVQEALFSEESGSGS